MFIEYYCEECNKKELDSQIIPLKKCPKCKHLMLANEWDFDEAQPKNRKRKGEE